jgi:NitT/TauT family transport system substrate-binding protein
MWVARKDFLDRNRGVMVDFMADALRARRFYIDPKNHNEAVDIVSRVTKQPRGQLDSWLFTKDDVYRAPDGMIDIAMLQRNIDKMVELGFLKTGIDARKYQDLSIVKDAVSRLENSN